MNKGSHERTSDVIRRVRHVARLIPQRRCARAFGGDASGSPAIDRILVINLEREYQRWGLMEKELGRLRNAAGRGVSSRVHRLDAVDARLLDEATIREAPVETSYRLADQLAIDPEPLLDAKMAGDTLIQMTRQEVAVALSHIRAWESVAESRVAFTLVLEDDVVPVFRFARNLDDAWRAAHLSVGADVGFEMLYLSYDAVGAAKSLAGAGPVLVPPRGLWGLSGYVLSRSGARRLLGMLPVRGPVDLWVNHQFERMNVLAVRRPVLWQRYDVPSTNSYSAVPILTKLGVMSDEGPKLPKARRLTAPVFATGQPGSGLTSLGTALSMLGYRCCSDWSNLHALERLALDRRRGARRFDAYVNIATFRVEDLCEFGRRFPRAKFVVCHPASSGATTPSMDDPTGLSARLGGQRVLQLPVDSPNKWQVLCTFLDAPHPTSPFPDQPDAGVRRLLTQSPVPPSTSYRNSWRQERDATPWVMPDADWTGLHSLDSGMANSAHVFSHDSLHLGASLWRAREDTFPDNLAMFSTQNVAIGRERGVRLTLGPSTSDIRDFTAGGIATTQRFRYGRFAARVRPARVPGLITGIFLHRDLPRQEIDIELLGRDTRRMLVNVYYNPGTVGARMQYGYRGAPSLIDLGFDAADDFHLYEIEWTPSVIRWMVDGRVVHERGVWDPTPIPNQPLEFNINLWASRSAKLAGHMAVDRLPAATDIQRLAVNAVEICPANDILGHAG